MRTSIVARHTREEMRLVEECGLLDARSAASFPYMAEGAGVVVRNAENSCAPTGTMYVCTTAGPIT